MPGRWGFSWAGHTSPFPPAHPAAGAVAPPKAPVVDSGMLALVPPPRRLSHEAQARDSESDPSRGNSLDLQSSAAAAATAHQPPNLPQDSVPSHGAGPSTTGLAASPPVNMPTARSEGNLDVLASSLYSMSPPSSGSSSSTPTASPSGGAATGRSPSRGASRLAIMTSATAATAPADDVVVVMRPRSQPASRRNSTTAAHHPSESFEQARVALMAGAHESDSQGAHQVEAHGTWLSASAATSGLGRMPESVPAAGQLPGTRAAGHLDLGEAQQQQREREGVRTDGKAVQGGGKERQQVGWEEEVGWQEAQKPLELVLMPHEEVRGRAVAVGSDGLCWCNGGWRDCGRGTQRACLHSLSCHSIGVLCRSLTARVCDAGAVPSLLALKPGKQQLI